LPAGELLAVLASLEHVEIVQRRIARLVGNALGIHRSNESFRADTGKGITIDVKDICVLAIARAGSSQLLRVDALNLSQQAVEQSCILVAVGSLHIQTRELHAKHGALPFAEPVIGTINKVAVEPLAGHAAAIVDGAGQPFDYIVICDDYATFSGGDQLAGLKAEC